VSVQPVEIETRVGMDGAVTPLRILWQGRWVQIGQISRTWSDDDGDHWLVMITPPQKVLDIIHTPQGEWRVYDPSSRFVA